MEAWSVCLLCSSFSSLCVSAQCLKEPLFHKHSYSFHRRCHWDDSSKVLAQPSASSPPPVSAGAMLNWDTSITVVSDEEVRARLTATSVKSKQETQPDFHWPPRGLPCSSRLILYSLSTLYWYVNFNWVDLKKKCHVVNADVWGDWVPWRNGNKELKQTDQVQNSCNQAKGEVNTY